MPVSATNARSFLMAHLGRDPGEVELVGEGAWSRCFGFEHGGRELVIRFGRFLEDFEKDRHAAGFRGDALPVPELLELGAAFDGHFAISTRAHGEPLESLGPEAWVRTLPSLLTTLDAIRSVELSRTRGFGLWDRSGNAPFGSWRSFLLSVEADTPERRTHGWRKKLGAAPGGDVAFRSGLARLVELTEAISPERHLVHSDFINRNVLVQEHRLAAVFDWGCSLYGDFLYDIAWIEFWAPWFPAIESDGFLGRVRSHWDEEGLVVPDLEARLQTCLIHIGLDHLAYNAHTGDLGALADVTRRLLPLID